jgi:hypothetical protein
MKNPRTKEEQAQRLLEIKEKWQPRGEKAGEATHKAAVRAGQATQVAAQATIVVVKGYVSKALKA